MTFDLEFSSEAESLARAVTMIVGPIAHVRYIFS